MSMVSKVEASKDRIPLSLKDNPMGGMGQSEEVASAVHFLASGASSPMSVAIVNVAADSVCW